MATSTEAPLSGVRGGLDALNSRHHQLGLRIFLFSVVAHCAEHLVQAIQIYALGWPLPEARGVLGVPFPWLVTSEWMHYGYALLMMIGLFMLRPGFTGASGTWWKTSLGLQIWHHLEHLLLLLQALAGAYLLDKAAPTSIIQLIMPRVELHLFYNTLVTIPMVIAMYLHTRAGRSDNASARCHCAPKD
ncbi:hypothetical protein [Streptomyces katsurahamanus]|uniref:Uncharacterized protein n=1 Tax=Streptomyces katsurahamanus TaxID=2577098 RepID=A0ABW9NNJ8_9ACTN|nr:hypothetical protein [Streptomyces katsurahamanus]MQS34724.1 hypothetical protein [Streptomyces katsurahamanus]